MTPLADDAPRLLSVGAATLDTIFRLETLPTTSGKFIPTEALEIAAGMATSAAVAARRLGANAALCACIGDDARAEQLMADYAAEGLDCRFVRRVPGARSAFSTILVDARGDRIIVPRYDPSLLQDISWLPLDEVATFDVVLADVRWPAASAAILRAARAANTPSLLDADTAAPDVLDLLVPLASHCVFSEPAALTFTATDNARDAVQALARLLPNAFVAVTAGPEGCFWFDRDLGAVQSLAAPAIQAVDTLAAGDVFHGAFAVGLAEGRPVADIVRRANAAAALKCTRFGGRLGAPTRDELDSFLSAQQPLISAER
jgi:sulfofructose kinase